LSAPRCLRAHVHADRVLIWQAHGHAVADDAIARGRFGGPLWSATRHTRFRLSLPSLLARCAWGTSPGRERVLGVWLQRSAFDALIRQAVPAAYEEGGIYASAAAMRLATRFAQVTVSWHPDCDMAGRELPDETVRVMVRDQAARVFCGEGVVAVEDWTARLRSLDTVDVPEPEILVLEPTVARVLSGRG
jgi:hypothetical protein